MPVSSCLIRRIRQVVSQCRLQIEGLLVMRPEGLLQESGNSPGNILGRFPNALSVLTSKRIHGKIIGAEIDVFITVTKKPCAKTVEEVAGTIKKRLPLCPDGEVAKAAF